MVRQYARPSTGSARSSCAASQVSETLARPPKNRLLNAPKMHYIPKLSLPQLMANYAEPREQALLSPQSVVPAAPSTPSNRKSTKRQKSFAGQRATVALAPTSPNMCATPSNSSVLAKQLSEYHEPPPLLDSRPTTAFTEAFVETSGWPVSGGGLGAYKKAQSLFDTHFQRKQYDHLHLNIPAQGDDDDEDSEFMRRRRVHPRLRWPRLASREAPFGDGGSGNLHEFHHDTSESSFVPMTPSTPSRPAKNPLRPAILPRVKSQAPVRPGTASTLHVPLGEDFDMNEQDFDGHDSGGLTMSSMNSLASWSFTPSSNQMPSGSQLDRKWFMRMAPISCLPSEPSLQAARKAVAARSGIINDEAGDYLNIRGWGINDDYLDALLAAHRRTSGLGVRLMNLSQNQITEAGIKVLDSRGCRNLKGLNLASNRLGERGGFATVELVSKCPQLTELDLGGNALGDAVAEELCVNLERLCRELTGLRLAYCELGWTPRAGIAIGSLVSSSNKLKTLDLNWNMFHGSGACALLQGLYDNGTSGMLLSQLNLAWNRLGSGLNANTHRKNDAGKASKLLGSVFAEGTILFHVDISYNGFNASECAILSDGLKFNHTLFGLHMLGNEATVDDLGFVVPVDSKPRGVEAFNVPEAQPISADDEDYPQEPEDGEVVKRRMTNNMFRNEEDGDVAISSVSLGEFEMMQTRVNRYVNNVPAKFRKEHPADLDLPDVSQDEFSANIKGISDEFHSLRHNPSLQSLIGNGHMSFSDIDLQAEHRWVQNRSRVQPVGYSLSSHSEALQRNAKCCWICENWQEHKVTYIPGLSGPERTLDEIENIYALYSIDGFTRPTKMTRHEELALGGRHTVKMSTAQVPNVAAVVENMRGSDAATRGSQTSGGSRLAKRMSRMPHAIVSNGKIVKWVGVRMLPPSLEPMELVFVINGQVSVSNDLAKKPLRVPKTITLKSGESASKDQGGKVVTITETNLLMIGEEHRQQRKQGVGKSGPLVILEDPSNRGEFTVFPRKLAEVTLKTKPKEKWTFESSSFKEFNRDSDEKIGNCFDIDWKNSRLGLIIKDESTRKNIQAYLKPLYRCFICNFLKESLTGFDSKIYAAGLSFFGFRDWIIETGGQGPGKFIDGQACKINDPDCIFIAANVIDKAKKKEFKVMPEKGLARFQFLESVVRLAFRRFLNGSATKSSPEQCLDAVQSAVGMLRIENVVQLRNELHEALFTEECCLLYREHMDMLKTVYEGYKNVSCYPGRAGKSMSFGAWGELAVDCNIINEDFPNRYVGYAFALGKEIHVDNTADWRFMELNFSEFLVTLGAVAVLQPDYHREFIADILEELLVEHIELARNKKKKAGRARASTADPTMAPMVAFLQKMFEDADDDASGTVDLKEFRRVFNQPQYKAEMGRLGVTLSEVDMLFVTFDRDGTGSLSLDEIVDGFVKIKISMKGISKAISYVRKVFDDADADKSGTLDYDEFRTLFSKPEVVKKIETLGISYDDISELFQIVEQEGKEAEVTVNQIIDSLVRARDPSNAGKRGLRILQKHFESADEDGSGELSKEEVMTAFNSETVLDELNRAKLKAPDWGTLFEELDVDGSGGLSWEELEEGMNTYWAKETFSSITRSSTMANLTT